MQKFTALFTKKSISKQKKKCTIMELFFCKMKRL